MTLTTTSYTETTAIDVNRSWDYDSVREACIRHQLYTCGTNAAYSELLYFADENKPTVENIYKAAVDIFAHSSEGWDLDSIMGILENEAVHTFFSIEDEARVDAQLAAEAEAAFEAECIAEAAAEIEAEQADDVNRFEIGYKTDVELPRSTGHVEVIGRSDTTVTIRKRFTTHEGDSSYDYRFYDEVHDIEVEDIYGTKVERILAYPGSWDVDDIYVYAIPEDEVYHLIEVGMRQDEPATYCIMKSSDPYLCDDGVFDGGVLREHMTYSDALAFLTENLNNSGFYEDENDIWWCLEIVDERPVRSPDSAPECWDEDGNYDAVEDPDNLFRFDQEEYDEKDYGPSNPWDAPGMKVSDFITGVSPF